MATRSTGRGTTRTRRPPVSRLTPVLYVKAIEPVLPFWEALGFAAPSRWRSASAWAS